jgi:hypothetical protein
VDVIHAAHALDLVDEVAPQALDIDIRGRALEKDVQRFVQERPGAAQDEQQDQHG